MKIQLFLDIQRVNGNFLILIWISRRVPGNCWRIKPQISDFMFKFKMKTLKTVNKLLAFSAIIYELENQE